MMGALGGGGPDEGSWDLHVGLGRCAASGDWEGVSTISAALQVLGKGQKGKGKGTKGSTGQPRPNPAETFSGAFGQKGGAFGQKGGGKGKGAPNQPDGARLLRWRLPPLQRPRPPQGALPRPG